MKKKGIIAGVAAALAIVLAVAVIIGVAKSNKVDPRDYVSEELTVVGPNGYGEIESAKVDLFDSVGFCAAITKADPQAEDNIRTMWNYYDLGSCIDVNIDDSLDGKLKNGDKVIVTISVNKERINTMDIVKKKVSGDEVFQKEYTVQGLKEPTVFDPFEVIKGVYKESDDDAFNVYYDLAYEKKMGECTAKYSLYTNSIVVNTPDGEVRIGYSGETLDINRQKIIIDESYISNETELKKYNIIVKTGEKTFDRLPCKAVKKASDIDLKYAKAIKADIEDIDDYKSNKYEFVAAYFAYREEKSFFSDEPDIDSEIHYLYKGIDSNTGQVCYVDYSVGALKNTDDKALYCNNNILKTTYRSESADEFVKDKQEYGYSVQKINI